MKASESAPGMRIDLVAQPHGDVPAEIFELKRGKHQLLARRGKPTERLSAELEKAIKQLRGYGNRIVQDEDARTSVELKCIIKIMQPDLRLIAGRRLSNANEYHLLSTAESSSQEQELLFQIATWDGFLAELERVVG